MINFRHCFAGLSIWGCLAENIEIPVAAERLTGDTFGPPSDLPARQRPAPAAALRAAQRRHLAGRAAHGAAAHRGADGAAPRPHHLGRQGTRAAPAHAHGLCLRPARCGLRGQDARQEDAGRHVPGRAAAAHARGCGPGHAGAAGDGRRGRPLRGRVPLGRFVGGTRAPPSLWRGRRAGLLDPAGLRQRLRQRLHGPADPVQGNQVFGLRRRPLPDQGPPDRRLARRRCAPPVLRGRLAAGEDGRAEPAGRGVEEHAGACRVGWRCWSAPRRASSTRTT